MRRRKDLLRFEMSSLWRHKKEAIVSALREPKQPNLNLVKLQSLRRKKKRISVLQELDFAMVEVKVELLEKRREKRVPRHTTNSLLFDANAAEAGSAEGVIQSL